MKLSKKEEKELMKVYETWWHSYLNGDVKTYDLYFTDDYRFVGSTNGEEYLNRKDTTAFFKATADQLAGKAELRNLKRSVEELEGGVILITDLADAYVISQPEWVFYSRFRFTSMLRKTAKGWRFFYQHFSAPDTKAQEGETLGTQQITKENEELRDAIKRRTVELEQKNKELEIEAALERVRARTMAMHSSGELGDVATVLFKELNQLVDNLWSCGFVLCEKGRGEDEWWLSTGDGFIPAFYLPNTGDVTHHNLYKSWENGENYHTEQLEGKALLEHYDWLMNEPVSRKIFEEMLAAGNTLPTWQKLHCAYFSYGYLVMITQVPCPEEQIFKRFAQVFDQTYTRFLDLQKAEAQARESQIELGLERVRARAMAMQRSDELKELVSIVSVELGKLDIVLDRCFIVIYDVKTSGATWWMSNPETPTEPLGLFVKYHEYPPYMAHLKAWREKKVKWQYILEGATKKEWDKFLFDETELSMLPDFVIADMRANEKVYLSSSFNNFGYLSLATLQPLSEEQFEILLRFAKVFDLTYTRFNDLKQAEAQARESQIQLAMERVRARTMAMQKSDELAEAASLLFTQIADLGTNSWSSGFIIFQPDELSINSWMSKPDGSMGVPFNIPVTEDPFFIKIYEAYKRGEEFLVMESSGKELVETYKYMFSLPGAAKALGAIEDLGFQMPTYQITHCVFFPTGFLMFITYESCQEMWDIFKRFGKVFEQTYTRFLDLQKAEAQAREAQIENALEKVRSRTMAMQKSEELPEAANVLFLQVQSLGIPAWSCGYNILAPDKKSSTCIMSSEGEIQVPFVLPLTEHWSLLPWYEAIQNDLDFFVYGQGGVDLIEHYKYLATVPGLEKVFQQFDDAGISLPANQINHLVRFTNGFLLFITYESVPHAHEIFKRFGKVFEQTYTRFLDLQKAEAQAREAQIEGALEKVRSSSLAMHHSSELEQVVGSLFDRLAELGLSFDGAFIFIFDKEKKNISLWIATTHLSAPVKIDLPYDKEVENNSILKDLWNAIENGERIISKSYSGEVKNEYFRYVAKYNESKIPESVRQFQIEKESWTVHLATEKNSMIGFDSWSGHPTKEEDFKILSRFAKVFEQAFTRFLDLQKAEAQAREAQIELALERVRARTMAMQHSGELQDTSLILFQQLKELGEPAEQCTIGIVKESEGIIEISATLHGNIMQQTFRHKIDEPFVMSKIFRGWKDQQRTLVLELKEEELQKYNQYRNELVGTKTFPVKLLPGDRRIIHVAYFSKGMLALSTNEPRPSESLQLLERFAKVFEQTYTRFLDLQKAEAQAREAKIEAALERVRSRAMSMQNSDELKGVVNELRKQMASLGAGELETCAINLYDKSPEEVEAWVASTTLQGSNAIKEFHFSFAKKGIVIIEEVLNAYASGADEYITLNEGDKAIQWMSVLQKAQPEIYTMVAYATNFSKTGKLHVWWCCAFFPGGSLIMITMVPPDEASILILKRFAQVFGLAYRRFADLQKAEAQASEAKIEAALEKVRSRTMAMQTGEEVKDVVVLLYKELIALGVTNFVTCGYVEINEKTSRQLTWVTSPGGDSLGLFYLPLTGDPTFDERYEAWKKQQSIFHQTVAGEKRSKHLEYAITTFNSKEAEEMVRSQFPDPTVFYCFNFSHGYLHIVTGSKLKEEEESLLARFTRVFEQTYARFLDLQKAEAQAREAKIEAALERVRSRSMAMHKTDELFEAAELVYKELNVLGITSFNASYAFVHEDKKQDEYYGVNPMDGKIFPFPLIFPQSETPVMSSIMLSWKKSEPFNLIELDEEGVKKHQTYIGEHILAQLIKNKIDIPFSVEEFVAQSPKTAAVYSFNYTSGYLFIIREKKLTTDEEQTMLRFTKVFDQTYTRFLDLQKAEAQAREAQIEAALERTRTQSMLMQHSNELDITSRVFHEQLLLLGVDSALSYVWLPDVEKEKHLFWATWTEMENNSAVSQSKSVNYDLDKTEPYTAECFRAWESDEPVHVYQLSAAEVKPYFDNWSELLSGASKMKPEFFPNGMNYVEAFMKYGCFGVMLSRLLREDEMKILLRIAVEFERTYTRFLDLQKAEAQAREAQIEGSLERVRSKAMAMHSSQDLSDTIGVFYRELQSFSITPRRCGVGLLNEKSSEGEIFTWNTTEKGESLELVGKIKMEGHPILENIYKNWLTQTEYHPVLRGNEIKEYYQVIRPQINFPDYAHEEVQYGYFFYFKEGGVYAWTEKEMDEDELKIYRRFTSVLSLTYKRYTDLKEAEMQTHKANIEVALERVRARALAMQEPEELIEVAEVLRHEMGLLGVEELETCSIYINDEAIQRTECWYALKDIREAEKKLVSDHFPLNLTDTWVGREMLKFYQSAEKKFSILMQGDNRKEWINYCEEKSVPFRGYYGDVIPDRTYHLHKFSHGAIGAASAGDISAESWDMLRRAASVFSLAYSRFKDLTQARTDLINLKEEKQKAEDALTNLKAAQSQLVQSEKMASLGELTAGIAHEIQNPLNFVNNFSEVSKELLDEIKEELAKGNTEEANEIMNDVIQNLEKINHHGKRADGIVKGMLQHSRSSSGTKEPTDINALADEYLRLAYHGLRAKDKSFNATMKTEYEEGLEKVNVIPQDLGRAILNLITNAFYAVNEKNKKGIEVYEPIVTVKTFKNPPSGGRGAEVLISVSDNGGGIPQKVLDKIFQPFFTTKPTGQGTGLGLSLAYDIVKAHGGELKVDTKEGEGTTFIIVLPIN